MRLLSGSWAHRHALLAALDHTDRSGACPDELSADFARLRMGQFLLKWCGRRPPGVRSALNRLGQQHAPLPHAYTWLLDLLEYGGQAAKTIRHDKALTFTRIIQFSRLPDWLCVAELPADVDLSLGSLSSLCAAAERLERSGKVRRTEIIDSVVGWGQIGVSGFTDDLEKSAGRFPPPLLTGSAQLRFLGDEAAIHEARKRFNNCIRPSRSEREGRSALYEWGGDEPAIVWVQHQAGYPFVTELRGMNNQPLSVATQIAISDHIRLLLAQTSRSVGACPAPD